MSILVRVSQLFCTGQKYNDDVLSVINSISGDLTALVGVDFVPGVSFRQINTNDTNGCEISSALPDTLLTDLAEVFAVTPAEIPLTFTDILSVLTPVFLKFLQFFLVCLFLHLVYSVVPSPKF